MIKKKTFYLFLFILFGCHAPDGSTEESGKEKIVNNDFRFRHKIEVNYAQGFSVSYHSNYKIVTVPEVWSGGNEVLKYLLVQKGTKIPDHDPSARIIKIPVNNIVCTSTTHIPSLQLLGLSEKLAGFPNTDLISSKNVRSLIDEGKVKNLGSEKGMNIESLMELAPDLVMDYSMGNNMDQYKSIQNAGIPVIINNDFLENHPLGRAEWIKFTALFFNKEKEADAVFKGIERRYKELKSLASKAKKSPTVFSGIVYGDTWFLPGGKNSGTKFILDAGGDYLWKDTNEKGSLRLSFESVYEKAHRADYWIGVASFKSLKEIKETDIRYNSFKAFKNGNVFSYNAKTGAKGGSVFLELGYARPDLVLADLIKILHPVLLPDHELYFYEKLE